MTVSTRTVHREWRSVLVLLCCLATAVLCTSCGKSDVAKKTAPPNNVAVTPAPAPDDLLEKAMVLEKAGDPASQKQAVELYTKAADAGYPPAQYRLGLCYLNGVGVEANHELAVKHLRTAAGNGNVGAKNTLDGMQTTAVTAAKAKNPKEQVAALPGAEKAVISRTLTLADGSKYVGELKDGVPNGQGTFTFPDGETYVGEWMDGKPNGQGTKTLPNGEKYVGEFKDGKYNGQGTLIFPDGQKYVGEFNDDKYNGQGTLTFPDGQKYVGEWMDGKRNGQGTWTYADGAKFVGEWKDGKPNGRGTLTGTDGKTYAGEFRDGKPTSQCVVTLPGGNVADSQLGSQSESVSSQPAGSSPSSGIVSASVLGTTYEQVIQRYGQGQLFKGPDAFASGKECAYKFFKDGVKITITFYQKGDTMIAGEIEYSDFGRSLSIDEVGLLLAKNSQGATWRGAQGQRHNGPFLTGEEYTYVRSDGGIATHFDGYNGKRMVFVNIDSGDYMRFKSERESNKAIQSVGGL